MEARNPRFQAKILVEVAAHALGKELLPAIAILRQGWISILFLQRNNFIILLLVAVVDTGRRGVEETLYAAIARGHQHMSTGQDGQHAERFVVLNKTHAAHIRRELKDAVHFLGGFKAVFAQLQIQHPVIGVRIFLVPLVERFDIDRADTGRTFGKELVHQMAANKAAGATNKNIAITN